LPKQRFVDFNQGVDARLFTEEKTELLSQIAIRPLRIAFDNMKTLPDYDKAIRLSAKSGIKNFSNYLLYNFKDKPIELWQRLKINIDLCEELDINIYSFPMKYHPIKGKFSHNRDFIGEHWNRKYIRAVQAVLNSTKGKIGRDSNKSESFFEKAFGHSEEEFLELLEMPETMIIYRFFFEWLEGRHEAATANWRKSWQECLNSVENNTLQQVLKAIHNNDFSNIDNTYQNSKISNLVKYYTNYRNEIVKPGTELYKLKQKYDKNPIRKLKRK
jgi:predicted transcriptional regulator